MTGHSDVRSTETAGWDDVLAYRADPVAATEVINRLVAAGVTPDAVSASLRDAGSGLADDAVSGRADWAASYGGLLAAALIASEVAAYASHLISRASAIRSIAIDALLDDHSAVSVAADLGVSRQKVYEIARDSNKRRIRMRGQAHGDD